MSITIGNVAEGLNQIAVAMAPQIQTELRQGLELEMLLQKRYGDDLISSTTLEMDDVIQPYQWEFTPNNNETFEGIDFPLEDLKMDLKWTQDDLDEFHKTWYHEWRQLGDAMVNKNFFAYLYQQEIIPKVTEEINNLDMNGARVDPTPGVAGSMLESMDGLKTVIQDAIAGSVITPITTGALTASDAVDKMELFVDGLPAKYQKNGGTILCSTSNQTNYARNYRDNYGSAVGSAENKNPENKIDGFPIYVKGVTSLEGSDMLIFIPDRVKSFYIGKKTGMTNLLPQLRWQEDERILKGLGEFYRCVGYTNPFNLFVNDQDNGGT